MKPTVITTPPSLRCGTLAANGPLPVFLWKVTHIADDGTTHVQQLIAPSNLAAHQWMTDHYGLPRFASALRLSQAQA